MMSAYVPGFEDIKRYYKHAKEMFCIGLNVSNTKKNIEYVCFKPDTNLF